MPPIVTTTTDASPPRAWRIANWDGLYEADRYGRAATADTPADEYRQGPLAWVRLRVAGHAHAMGPGYRSLMAACQFDGARVMAAFAVFCKLLEFAADLPRELRGWVLTHHHQPAGPADLEFYTGFPREAIEQALADLSDQRVRWIEQVAYSAGVPAPSGRQLQQVAPDCSAAQPVAAPRNPSRARAGANQTRPDQTRSDHHQTRSSEGGGGGGGGGDSAGSQGGTDSADQARRVGVVGVMTRAGCTPKQVSQVIEMCGPVKPLVLETEDARRIAGQIAKDQTVRNQAACLTHRLVELATARRGAAPCRT